ncbi:MAG TPA: ABC transporter ATP-binding protein [Anaerohalosphaeraceae bacterium]|nr:ABC transporter ATP-binding protein [Anaerohalosphaeraceae bacterium]HOL31291.1 ABC transporter ATP-binding protein [Anaerohalosphaeraceae bacterium]HOM76081.1 ABC transporter ATP-binding protein [Anaerohalosphaeraceae bacterium]HPC64803.1 ABC transporter ATP-binding protein [Anaerohalosphaeraceae bacterium]HPO69656.1 ABC transporter ATP-binding protein [Anaerohalosphaeraceae bacterium]
MLELINVCKKYSSPAGDVAVLNNINLFIEAGQSVSIMGPSGSGKTTLLNLMGGLDRPTEGKVILEQKNLGQLSGRQLARVRNSQIGFVFQLHYLLPQCTVLENVLLPTLAVHQSTSQREDSYHRAMNLLERTGLRRYADARPGQLSGGQRQRAAVVRALICRPRILLADEPTGSLDADTAEQISDLLLELNQSESVALVVATHSEKLAAKARRRFRLEKANLTEV